MDLTVSPPADARRRPWLARFTRVATMVAFTAITAVISYTDGLYLIRYAGADGWSAYLYPLLPDGLILICSVRLYEAAPERPRWAMAGVIIGIVLTLAMNVGAGVLHNWMYALADGVVPVIFFVALEVLRGAVRRREAASVPAADTAAAALPGPERTEPEPAEPRVPEAILLDLIKSGTRQEIGDLIGVSKSRVQRLHDRLTRPVQDGPEEAPAEPGETAEDYWAEPPAVSFASVNGSGPHA